MLFIGLATGVVAIFMYLLLEVNLEDYGDPLSRLIDDEEGD